MNGTIPTKCAIESCNNRPLILYFGRFVCGECCMKIKKKVDEERDKQLKRIEEELNNNI